MSGISNYDMVYHDALANFPGVFVTSAGNETEDNDAIYSFPAAF